MRHQSKECFWGKKCSQSGGLTSYPARDRRPPLFWSSAPGPLCLFPPSPAPLMMPLMRHSTKKSTDWFTLLLMKSAHLGTTAGWPTCSSFRPSWKNTLYHDIRNLEILQIPKPLVLTVFIAYLFANLVTLYLFAAYGVTLTACSPHGPGPCPASISEKGFSF
ncbi:hypothetical protein F5141DRAFT_1053035 [Pisolithus sp. B1]|nr:hypothetical protein F5141DRAFT_1053035 [Pisolithus sp. B1]